MAPKKHDPELIAFLLENGSLNRATGRLKFNNVYVSIHLDIGWKGDVVSVPYSHAVWLLEHGCWPREGFFIDHKNDDAMDNRPGNHQELTSEENHAKRRGRMVYRSYGKGKYGYGIGIRFDPRDQHYYITRYLSRGYGEGDLKNIKKSLGRASTLEEAEKQVANYIEEIKTKGLDYLPEYEKKQSKKSIELVQKTERIRALRREGRTLQEIADMTGFSIVTISNKTKDIQMDGRRRA